MGISKLFKHQMRSVIEWKEQDTNILFHRLETSTDEIKNSSKLIVAPGQGCLLVYDGKVKATLTEPDTYELQTDNHPFSRVGKCTLGYSNTRKIYGTEL